MYRQHSIFGQDGSEPQTGIWLSSLYTTRVREKMLFYESRAQSRAQRHFNNLTSGRVDSYNLIYMYSGQSSPKNVNKIITWH